jgi:peroxiredoxin Q/BCP
MEFPDVELEAHTGEKISPARVPRAVVYFFSKAFTQGCTRETIRFNELYPRFRERGYEVFGVSTDGVETLKRLASRLGILRPTGTAERVTYILNDGKVVHILRGLRSAEEHADKALELI